jgi:fumarate hydratase class II
MNMNEVLANRASELLGGERGQKRLVHPNDDVNKGQSSNDVFPTAMHVAAVMRPERKAAARAEIAARYAGRQVAAFADIVKIGRTHLQDATPLTLGQEFPAMSRSSSTASPTCGRAARICASWRSAAPRSAPGSMRTRSSAARAAKARGAHRAAVRPAPNKFEALAATMRWCTRTAR